MHEAFAAALSLWPRSGVPDNPRLWLISTARFKAIDTLRRRARFDASQDDLARYLEVQWSSAERSNSNEENSYKDDGLEDDRLRLIFYLLSSISSTGSARRAHLASGVRADHRGDSQGLPHHSAHARLRPFPSRQRQVAAGPARRQGAHHRRPVPRD
jgi:hypothetical protein